MGKGIFSLPRCKQKGKESKKKWKKGSAFFQKKKDARPHKFREKLLPPFFTLLFIFPGQNFAETFVGVFGKNSHRQKANLQKYEKIFNGAKTAKLPALNLPSP